MYRKRSCYEDEFNNLANYKTCKEEENEIDIDKNKIEVEDAINTSINNKGFLIQIGALIIFDDVFDLPVISSVGGTPFELKIDEAGITINGTKLDTEKLKDTKALIIKKEE